MTEQDVDTADTTDTAVSEEAESPVEPSAGSRVDSPDQGSAGERSSGRNPLRNPVVVAAVALLGLCAAAAVWFGVAWVRAEADDALDTARARDEAARTGEQAVLLFHTMDHKSVDAQLALWVDASTGDMLDQLERGKGSAKAIIEQRKRISTATAYSTAVIDLNDTTGTATIISAVHQKISEDDAAPVDKYLRVQAALQRGEQGWKLTGIAYIAPTPVG
ncbi:hypothetical protein ACTG9Q_04135 [Actinokineospora sp. 24-640]